jgi:hypothetical protein
MVPPRNHPEKSGSDWVKEATACGKNSDPRFEGFMVSLCRAFSLLGEQESFSAPRDDTARASSGNGAKAKSYQ